MSNSKGRSSGFDFADRAPTPTDMHPDIMLSSERPNLQRNKTERTRLQGLMRLPNTVMKSNNVRVPGSLKERWDLWMINEGGKRIFFFSWVFLHLLVFAFGWVNYQLKDNEVNARALFGETFGELSSLLSSAQAAHDSRK